MLAAPCPVQSLAGSPFALLPPFGTCITRQSQTGRRMVLEVPATQQCCSTQGTSKDTRAAPVQQHERIMQHSNADVC